MFASAGTIALGVASVGILLGQSAPAEKPSPVPAHSRKQARAQALQERRHFAPLPSPLLIASSEQGNSVYFHRKSGKTEPALRGVDPSSPIEYAAEHPYFPLGSVVRVTNTQNGLSIKARVTGRISPTARFIVSVDEQAARELEFYKMGIGQVRVELIGK